MACAYRWRRELSTASEKARKNVQLAQGFVIQELHALTLLLPGVTNQSPQCFARRGNHSNLS